MKDKKDQDDIVSASYDGNFDLVRRLISQGADPNTTNEYGENGVMVAAEHGYDAIIEYLLDMGTDINAVDQDGDTALDIARYHEHSDTIALLLARGGTGANGPSAKERMMDSYYDACDHANSMKNLLNEINKKKP